MRYEIGEYGLTRKKVSSWASETPIHYLWYVEGSASGIKYDTYEEAVEAIKERMRADKETGRQDKGDIILYFTAGWEDTSCNIKIHASGSYDEVTLDIIRAYDDRIIFENI